MFENCVGVFALYFISAMNPRQERKACLQKAFLLLQWSTQCLRIIEIGLEQAPFVFFNLFFSTFEHVKIQLIMGPNNTKNSSLKCDFHIINYE
jgi:hypothetical protein